MSVINKITELFVKLKDGVGTAITSTDLGSGKQGLDVNSTPSADEITEGTITILGGTVTTEVKGFKSIGIVITGTWVATLVYEISSDSGSTWVQSSVNSGTGVDAQLQIVSPTIYVNVTSNGTYYPNTAGGITDIRLRASLFTSGTVNVSFVKSESSHQFTVTQSSIIQQILNLSGNSSSTNLDAFGIFIGTTDVSYGMSNVQVQIISSEESEVHVQQSIDGINWDIDDVYYVERNIGHGRGFKIVSNYIRVMVRNVAQKQTEFFRLLTSLVPVGEVLPRSLTSDGNLRVAIAEQSPYIQEGNLDKYHMQDIESRQVLEDILQELKKMNMYFEIITDENIKEHDVKENFG